MANYAWWHYIVLLSSQEIICLPGPSRINDSGGLMDLPAAGSMISYHD